MAAKNFTANLIAKAQKQAAPYEIWSTNPKGLLLRVYPSGRKTYFCQYARAKRVKIGDAMVVTLERARYKAREILNEAQDHATPLKRDQSKSTLRGFIEHVYAPWARSNRRRAEETLKNLKHNFENLYDKKLTGHQRLRLGRICVGWNESASRSRVDRAPPERLAGRHALGARQ